jgi:hypothetical protein
MVKDRELLTEGEDLEVQGGTTPNRSSQSMEQGNKDGSHAGHATGECPKKSSITRTTGFLVGTG